MRTRDVKLIMLLCALALSACATPIPPASVPVEVSCPKPAPAPADVMVERPANFLTRLLTFFSISPTTPTASPDNLPPVSR